MSHSCIRTTVSTVYGMSFVTLCFHLAAIYTLKALGDCDVTYSGELGQGVITSPHYPFPIQGPQQCSYEISLPHGSDTPHRLLCFHFNLFDLTYDGSCDTYLSLNGVKFCGHGHANILQDWNLTVWDEGLCWRVDSNCRTDLLFKLQFVSSQSTGKESAGFYLTFTLKEDKCEFGCASDGAFLHSPSVSHCFGGCLNGYKLNSDGCPMCDCRAPFDHSTVAPCNSGQFTCFNRRCVNRDKVCNGQDDCGDNSDEEQHHSKCINGQPGEPRAYFIDFDSSSPALHWSGNIDFEKRANRHGDNAFAVPDNSLSLSIVDNEHKYSTGCISFMYRLYDSDGETFPYSAQASNSFKILIQSATVPVHHSETIWMRNLSFVGEKVWHRGMVTYFQQNKLLSSYYITFLISRKLETTRLDVDNIAYTSGTCWPSSDISCRFNLGHSCGWEQKNIVDFIPFIKQLGVSWFHQPYSEGYYIRIEITPNIYQDTYSKLLIGNPVGITTADPTCLTFSFYMGHQSSGFKVYLLHYDSYNCRHEWCSFNVWTSALPSNYNSLTWLNATIDLASGGLTYLRKPYQVGIVAFTGLHYSYGGSVAFGIRDIVLYNHSCSSVSKGGITTQTPVTPCPPTRIQCLKEGELLCLDTRDFCKTTCGDLGWRHRFERLCGSESQSSSNLPETYDAGVALAVLVGIGTVILLIMSVKLLVKFINKSHDPRIMYAQHQNQTNTAYSEVYTVQGGAHFSPHNTEHTAPPVVDF